MLSGDHLSTNTVQTKKYSVNTIDLKKHVLVKQTKMILNQLMSLLGKIYYIDTKIDQKICLS